MYYSVNQPPPTISQQSSQSSHYEPVIRQQKRRLYIFLAVIAVVVFGGGTWWYGRIQAALSQPKPTTTQQDSASSESKPEVAGVSFGDLLKKQRSFAGWLAGVVDGAVVVMNPQSGEINTLTQVESQWRGPISALAWSPDRTKLAYLVLPQAEAEGFEASPQAQAQRMGLESVPTPQTFPFGRVVVLDVNTKQLVQTGLEVRNTPKSVIWLDDNRLAAITTNLSIYNLAEQQAAPVAGAGITDADGQLQSPLVWNPATESIYYTRVKKVGNQGARVAMQVSLTTNSAKELTILRSGLYEDVSSSRGVDMAMDTEGKRLAFIGQTSIAYLSLADGGVHALPPQDDWLWLKDSIISEVEWLSPSRVAFVSMAGDGAKVWVVWDIPEAKIITFGRGASAGSWDKGSGRLALVQAAEDTINLLTPNWQNPLESTLESFDLPWQSITW